MEVYAPYAMAADTTPLLGNCFSTPPTGRPCAGPPEDYVTAELRQALVQRSNEGTGIDAVICAQNTPDTILFRAPRVADSAATITVHVGFRDSGDHPVVVTVDLATLELTDVGC